MNISNLLASLTANIFGGNNGIVSMILLYAVVIGGLWFFMIRPQSKRKKQEEAMRNSLDVGDDVTTIGGIMGKIVSVKDNGESLVIETGVDRSKIRIKRWAIATCDNEKADSKTDSKNNKK